MPRYRGLGISRLSRQDETRGPGPACGQKLSRPYVSLAAARSYASIGAAAVVLAAGVLASQPALAAPSSTASANLVTSITPLFQEKTEYFGPKPQFTFTAVVTNEGPDPASDVVVSVSGVTNSFGGTVTFSVSPAGNCNTSGDDFTCSALPANASITAVIVITRYCPGHSCTGSVSTTAASSVTPDPDTANNSATGGWELVCFMRKRGI